jgi:uncharacterized membrane protein YoaK (UPF0700 family)
VRSPRLPPDVLAALLLAGASGVLDLVALVRLGGAFAGVMTGNMVVVGASVATADPGRLLAVGVAVVSFATGVAVWSAAWRRAPHALVGPLLVELGLLAAVVVVWVLTAGRVPLVVLAGAAVALGGQSVVGLRLGTSTTYLTGTLTTALHTAATRPPTGVRRPVARGLGQLAALVVGAVAATLLLRIDVWAALLLAPVLVGLAAVAARSVRRESAPPQRER